MKDTAVTEEIEGNKVGVYIYDEFTKDCMSLPVEVCNVYVAHEKYKIVGVLVNGKVSVYSDEGDEEDDDYSLEDYGIEEDDD